ncbi:MAG TPA: hypothetical protein VFN09_00575, partial [Rhodanobacteraceae bacterium]|nr:hypothetical protein [Rhodanobacteraceae bacterium]
MTALAWLAPWLLGIGVWLVACGWPRRRAAWCAAAGGGWLLGNLAIGLALGGLQWAVSPQATVRVIGPWVLALGVLLTMLAWRWRRSAVTACPEPPLTWFGRALIGLLLMLLALRWGWMWQQATLPPLFPWDAWAAWSVKPAVWFSLDQWVPFVDASQWLSSADRGLYTSAAAGYPAWLGRLELWYAAGMGCWCDLAYTRLWPALWLALLLALYGLLRGLGVGRLIAVLAVYVLGSLPLLDVHAAMAGYADLWLAAYLVLGVLLWLHAWRLGGRARAALAVLLVLALPAVKLEGAVWMLLVLAAMAFALLPLRWRQRVVRWGAVAMAVLWLAVFVAGLPLPVPGLGLVYVDGSGLHVP